ncbi:MAG: hypothetical protein JRN26_08345 [Nitrososphaerota archaeon]|jgi:hypothetical protein|nr:hypothetical protein [Nitrososphaerota archaeon]
MSGILLAFGTGILIGIILSLFIARGVPSRRTREKAGMYIKSYGRYYKIDSYMLGFMLLAMGLIVLAAAVLFRVQQLGISGITVASLGLGVALGDLPSLLSDAAFRIRKRY